MRAIELSKKYRTKLDQAGINTPLRLAHFFAQLHHESGLKPAEENLKYSVRNLRDIFGKYFPDDATARIYVGHPKLIANKVYANRMGNGPEGSGDGYRFRGRGFIQITGRYNYTQLSDYVGVDYVNNPDKLLEEPDSMVSALWFWGLRDLNYYADLDNLRAITKRINGGFNGLAHRAKLLEMYKVKFKA